MNKQLSMAEVRAIAPGEQVVSASGDTWTRTATDTDGEWIFRSEWIGGSPALLNTEALLRLHGPIFAKEGK